jgi:NADH-quinone oxidoreductase subunit J
MEYLFYGLVLISAFMVLSAKNPVHSVLFLVLAFCNSAAILIFWGVEFLALLLLVIYVGAIAILFLFVIMMLNIRVIEIYENQMRYLPIGGVIACIFFLELYLIIEEEILPLNKNELFYLNWETTLVSTPHIQVIGELIYTEFAHLFILASLILLLAMIGALILTPVKGVVA